MKKVVIAGSVSLQKQIMYWKDIRESKGYEVIEYPKEIKQNHFIELYPMVYKDFFSNILQADILFIMNEDKNNIFGYIGAQVFAEMSFGVLQKQIYNKNIDVLLLKMPSEKNLSYTEVNLRLQLGWISLYKD